MRYSARPLSANNGPEQSQQRSLFDHVVGQSSSEFGRVRPGAVLRLESALRAPFKVARGDGSRQHLASVLQGGRKGANIHVVSGAIWGMAVKIENFTGD